MNFDFLETKAKSKEKENLNFGKENVPMNFQQEVNEIMDEDIEPSESEISEH